MHDRACTWVGVVLLLLKGIHVAIFRVAGYTYTSLNTDTSFTAAKAFTAEPLALPFPSPKDLNHELYNLGFRGLGL